MLIFDDFSHTAKQWKNSEVIQKIFYTGRHVGFTFVIGIHDSSLLSVQVRQNAHLSIFTTPTASSRFFENKSNGYGKNEKLEIMKVISAIWKEGDKTNYKRLVYKRTASPKYYYTIASIYDNYRFGSDYLWELYDSIYVPNQIKTQFTNVFSLP